MKITLPSWFLLTGILHFAGIHVGNAQHLYVRSNTDAVGGWIVDEQGETFFELPASWRLHGNNKAADFIHDWPALLEYFPRRDSAGYAFLHEDGNWELLTDFNLIKSLGKGCYWLGVKGTKEGKVRCGGETLVMPGLVGVSNFHSDGYAIGFVPLPHGRMVQGLINTTGEWIVPPPTEVVVPLGQNRYHVQDTLLQSYLLRISQRGSIVEIDTILDLSALGWRVHSSFPFDETGHTWVTLNKNQHLIIDTAGQVTADTIETLAGLRKAFSEGVSWIDQPRRLINTRGERLSTSTWEYILPASEGRILAQDRASKYFGYLDRTGEWTIPPVFCYGTSFRDGWALTGAPHPEGCGDRVFERRSATQLPASLQRYGQRGYYQLLDTTGQVVWADSCHELYLLPNRIILRNQSPSLLAPALRIDWLEEGRYWLSPDYHFTTWDQLLTAQPEEVQRIDLGSGRYLLGTRGSYSSLPEEFIAQLVNWPNLEALNLNTHQVATALLQIVELHTLRRLSLSHCSLENLPNDLDELEQLTHLDISSNALTTLPKSLYRMRHLQELNVADNPLPPDTIRRLRQRLPDTKIIYKREW